MSPLHRRSLVVLAALAFITGGCGVAEMDVQDDAVIYDEANFGDHIEVGSHNHEPNEELGTSESALTGSIGVGTRLKTTDALNLRSGPSTGYAILVTMPVGSIVTTAAGSPSNGFYKVTYGTRTGWAHGNWLVVASTGTTVWVSGGPVNSNVQGFANTACGATGACKISTYEGHHPSRVRALDILASNYYGSWPTDGWAKGDAVARHAFNNWGRYNIWYVIWRQRINYNDGRGWQWMADRGSITQNHYDHVHVSFW